MPTILIIKLSSLGDIIHTFPALTDAGKALSDVKFDWVVEEGFSEVVRWHPLVNRVIPISLRRWRKSLGKSFLSGEFTRFLQQLRAQSYNCVIDAQGLLKSALVTCLARGPRCGYAAQATREPLAAWFYQQRYVTPPLQEAHAIVRVRSLFAKALGYEVPAELPDAGIIIKPAPAIAPYVLLLHGTTWATKFWPVEYWGQLAQLITAAGIAVKVPFSNDKELMVAKTIQQKAPLVEILPKLPLNEMAQVVSGARAIVAVDTGLGHLAAALKIPTISLYGPTDPKRTGTLAVDQQHMSAQLPCMPCLHNTCAYAPDAVPFPACMAQLTPERVWERLQKMGFAAS